MTTFYTNFDENIKMHNQHRVHREKNRVKEVSIVQPQGLFLHCFLFCSCSRGFKATFINLTIKLTKVPCDPISICIRNYLSPLFFLLGFGQTQRSVPTLLTIFLCALCVSIFFFLHVLRALRGTGR